MTLDELTEKWEADKQWDLKNPVRSNFKQAWYFIIYRIPARLTDLRYEIKWGFQRMFRGYDDSLVWGYWYENAKLNVKVLKQLKKIKHGVPYTLEETTSDISHDEEFERQEKAWDIVMDKMINAWQAIIDEDDVHIKTDGKYDVEKSHVEREHIMKIFTEGMSEYTIWYRSLWD